MYEKTIAGESRIYSIGVTTTPTLIYDLLSPLDQADYDSILNHGIKVQSLNYPALNADVNRFRVPVDGYITSFNGDIYIATSQTGAQDVILKDFQYVFPVYFWPHKHWVSALSNTQSLVRIFFS
jgi:hypothetical protein